MADAIRKNTVHSLHPTFSYSSLPPNESDTIPQGTPRVSHIDFIAHPTMEPQQLPMHHQRIFPKSSYLINYLDDRD